MIVNATFEIEITPEEGLLPGTRRFEFAKVWTGEAEGASRGIMLSAGNPADGTAGYVALEVFEGRIGGRTGSVAFQQFGSTCRSSNRLGMRQFREVPSHRNSTNQPSSSQPH